MKQQVPAGFWIRFLAVMIDGLILMIPTLIITKTLSLLLPLSAGPGDIVTALLIGLLLWIPALILKFCYYNYFYRLKGASPGKQALDLKVLDLKSSEFLTTKQVFFREVLGKTLSSVLFGVGYIMAGVRGDKRALHDLIGDSRVVQEILGNESSH